MPPGEQQDAPPQVEALGNEPQTQVGARANKEGVKERAEAGSLPQGDPDQQNDDADEYRDEPERQARLHLDAERQHVPRGDAELAPHDHGDGEAVEEDAHDELRGASWQSDDGAHPLI